MLAAVLFLIPLAGCGGGPSKEDVLKELKPDENEQYAIHLFYKSSLPGSETTELNRFHNSDQRLTGAPYLTQVQEFLTEALLKE
ncbi:hypothetical protein [Paenibacillus catalpae]|uniref:hypothetical protein n=1 Tax=Paenibacillus catalpae TaxID=1045775 RepID=UPI000B855A07|nr:hypothetical protein [Paenibacillus catalpae]